MTEIFNIGEKYILGSLNPCVYLLPKDKTTISYKADNGVYTVTDIICNEIFRINGSKTMFKEEQNEKEMFSYKSTVTIDVNESYSDIFITLLEFIRKGRFYIVFEDKMGTQYIQSPEFTSDVSWKVFFNNSVVDSNFVELQFNADTNIPSLIVPNNIEAKSEFKAKCNYHIGLNKDLMICPKKYCYAKYNDNNILQEIYTTGDVTFSKIVPNDKSFTFTHTYKDDVYKDEITFTIPLSEYKNDFHNKLEEFNDNRYIIKFDTLDNKTIVCGLEFGLFPKYTITTSEEDEALNIITITFTHISQRSFVYSPTEIEIAQDVTTHLVPITVNIFDPNTNELLNTDFCIDDKQSIYTLLQVATNNTGQLLDAYYCLEGYEEYYRNINVIGTYKETDDIGIELKFNEFRCATEDVCKWLKRSPDIMYFRDMRDGEDFIIKSTCDWKLEQKPGWLFVNPVEGKANTDVTVAVEAIKRPLEFPLRSKLVFKSGISLMESTVILGHAPSWLLEDSYNITAKAQPVAIRHLLGRGDILTFNSLSNGIVNVSANDEYIVANVRDNDSYTTKATSSFVVKNEATGEEKQIFITQDILYQKWIGFLNGDYICVGKNSYVKEYQYIGYYPNEINIPTGEFRTGELIKEKDVRCENVLEKWVEADDFICVDNNKYKNLVKYESIDDGKTWTPTIETKLGRLIENNSPECSNDFFWKTTGKTICSEGDKYYVLEKYYVSPITGVQTPMGETKLGGIAERQSLDCLSKDENVIILEYTFGLFSENAENIFLITSTSNFTINWGDCSDIEHFRLENYEKGGYVKHRFTEDCLSSGNMGRLIITGGIESIQLLNPANTIGFDYRSFDITRADTLVKFISGVYPNAVTNHFTEFDLTNNVSLAVFKCFHNLSYDGITNFQFPRQCNLQQLVIGNLPDEYSYITSEQLQLILDNAPAVNKGLIDFCWQQGDTNAVCPLITSTAEENGWLVNKACCDVEGNIAYSFGDGVFYECDNITHTKWSMMRLYESIFQNGKWQTATPTNIYLRNEVYEYNSVECGYVSPIMYKWVMTKSYVCDGETSYYLEQKFVSHDGGMLWTPILPFQTRKSSVIKQVNDKLCGYIDPTARRSRWVEVKNEYICDEPPTE